MLINLHLFIRLKQVYGSQPALADKVITKLRERNVDFETDFGLRPTVIN